MRVEARSAEPLVALELAVGARADRERAQQEVERLADRVRVGVRAEVADALALLAAHHHGARPLLVERDREERVRLVVLQPDVEPRPVLLDEVVLEEERLDLVAHLDPLDGLRGLHHLAGARQERVRRGEVVRQPAAQALGLADVDDAAVRVLELVRARRVGDGAGGRAGDHGVSRPARRRARCSMTSSCCSVVRWAEHGRHSTRSAMRDRDVAAEHLAVAVRRLDAHRRPDRPGLDLLASAAPRAPPGAVLSSGNTAVASQPERRAHGSSGPPVSAEVGERVAVAVGDRPARAR